MLRTAFVAGATGLVGGHCLRILTLEDAYDRVVPLVRRPAGLTGERVVRFDNLEREDFDAGCDVFCALGTTIGKAGSAEAFRRVDYEYVTGLARRAAEQGARRFLVVSSVAADMPGSNLYLRTKAGMERDVSSLPFEAVHIFRPSFLMGEREESRPAEAIGGAVVRLIGWTFAGPLRKYHAIRAEQVAMSMVRAARYGKPGVHIHHYGEMVALAGTALRRAGSSGGPLPASSGQ